MVIPPAAPNGDAATPMIAFAPRPRAVAAKLRLARFSASRPLVVAVNPDVAVRSVTSPNGRTTLCPGRSGRVVTCANGIAMLASVTPETASSVGRPHLLHTVTPSRTVVPAFFCARRPQ